MHSKGLTTLFEAFWAPFGLILVAVKQCVHSWAALAWSRDGLLLARMRACVRRFVCEIASNRGFNKLKPPFRCNFTHKSRAQHAIPQESHVAGAISRAYGPANRACRRERASALAKNACARSAHGPTGRRPVYPCAGGACIKKRNACAGAHARPNRPRMRDHPHFACEMEPPPPAENPFREAK